MGRVSPQPRRRAPGRARPRKASEPPRQYDDPLAFLQDVALGRVTMRPRRRLSLAVTAARELLKQREPRR